MATWRKVNSNLWICNEDSRYTIRIFKDCGYYGDIWRDYGETKEEHTSIDYASVKGDLLWQIEDVIRKSRSQDITEFFNNHYYQEYKRKPDE